MSGDHNEFAGQGPVLLDIGEDVGALIITAPETMHGTEIEIRSIAGHGHPAHVAVLARQAGAGTAHTAVFPGLRQGSYELYERPHGPTQLQVTIVGGQVTQARWPES